MSARPYASSVQLNLPPSQVQTVDRQQSTVVHQVDRASEWHSLPGRALGRSGISFKAAAVDAECDPSLFSARLAGKKHLPWSSLGKLGAAFAAELVNLIIEFYDLPIGNLTEEQKRDMAFGREMRESLERRLTR